MNSDLILENNSSIKNFSTELQSTKLSITKFLLNLLIALTCSALIVYIYNFIFIRESFAKGGVIYSLIITLSSSILLIFIRIKFNKINYKVLITIIAIIFLLIALMYALIYGTYAPFHLPLIIIPIISITIVINYKISRLMTLLIFITYLIITELQITGHLSYIIDKTDSNIQNTIILFVFVWVILNISRIGYSQIEESYSKALRYSRELEELNKELDQKVKDRTKMLQNNFNSQIESMYNTAVIGSITKPLLHDLATPISSLYGVLDLFKKHKNFDNELIEIAESSINQINEVILESRDLMRGQNIIQKFNITEHIYKLIRILKNEFSKNEIIILFNETSVYEIKGLVSSFERIIMNLLVNAIEELKDSNKVEKVITISILKATGIIIKIKDNGKGIDNEVIKQIFNEDFSLKNSNNNLGLGLLFVKKTIQEKFNGDVVVESKKNEYTTFVLNFKF